MIKLPAVAAAFAAPLLFALGGSAAKSVRPSFGDPAWSPNGKLIALSSNRDDPSRFPDIYVMNAGDRHRRVESRPALEQGQLCRRRLLPGLVSERPQDRIHVQGERRRLRCANLGCKRRFDA
jgi:hypothetical protein